MHAVAVLTFAAVMGCTATSPARVVEASPAPQQGAAPTTTLAGTSRSAAASPGSGSSADRSAAAPVEIRTLELREGAPEVFVDLEASSPLVWTSFRNPEGSVVVELPNSLPAARVQDLVPDDGLVSSVKVQRETEGSRPMTRLVIATRHEVEHSVTADGLHLQIRLMPLEAPAATAKVVAKEPAKQKLAFEPVPAPAAPANAATPDSAQTAMSQTKVSTTPLVTPTPAQAAAATPPPTPATGEGRRTTTTTTSAGTAPMAPAPDSGNSGSASSSSSSGMKMAGTPDEPAVAPPPSGAPATRLEAVEVLTGADAAGGSVIRLSGDGEFPYSTFALSEPNRFVIDLQGVTNHAPRSTVSVAGSVVQRVRVAQFRPGAKGVARVVFDLKQSAVPRIERTPQALVISFSDGMASALPAPPASVAPPPAPVYAASSTSQSTTTTTATTTPAPTSRAKSRKSKAARSADSSDSTTTSTTQTTTTMAAPAAPPSDLALRPAPSTQIAQATPRRAAGIEVEDAPPVVNRPKGSGLPRVAQTANSLQQPSADLGRKQGPSTSEKLGTDLGAEQHAYTGEPIDLKVTNADVTEVLRTFAQISGLNIVVQPGVSGTVTAELENVPWDQAFEEVLKINNLGYEREGNVIRIAPNGILRQEAQERQQLAQARALVIPLRTVMRRLSYANAQSVAGLLKSGQAGLLTQRGSVIVDDRTNTLIIKELPDFLDAVLAVVSNLDTPEPQVMIEARIIETTKDFSRNLGITWGFNAISDAAHGNTTGLIFPNNGTLNGSVGLPAAATNGTLGLTLGNVLNTFNLDLTLQAAEHEGLINILSAPKVATLNNQLAYIQSGVQIPVQTIANNTVTVQFINATLRLEVTPQVTAEGTIMMDINISKKEPETGLLVAGATNAPISTKDAKTRLVVRDGGTAVIGGIYKVTSNSSEDRVPGLANLPIVGHLFRSKSRDENNDELLIFITPRVIKI
jgi:type IV pilus assembly protein PilQ